MSGGTMDWWHLVTTLLLPTVTSLKGSWSALIGRNQRFISRILRSWNKQAVPIHLYPNSREFQLWYLKYQRVDWLCYLRRHYQSHSVDGWRLAGWLLCKMLSVGLRTYKILFPKTSLHKTYQSSGKQGKTYQSSRKQGKDNTIEGMVEWGHTTRFEKE